MKEIRNVKSLGGRRRLLFYDFTSTWSGSRRGCRDPFLSGHDSSCCYVYPWSCRSRSSQYPLFQPWQIHPREFSVALSSRIVVLRFLVGMHQSQEWWYMQSMRHTQSYYRLHRCRLARKSFLYARRCEQSVLSRYFHYG